MFTRCFVFKYNQFGTCCFQIMQKININVNFFLLFSWILDFEIYFRVKFFFDISCQTSRPITITYSLRATFQIIFQYVHCYVFNKELRGAFCAKYRKPNYNTTMGSQSNLSSPNCISDITSQCSSELSNSAEAHLCWSATCAYYASPCLCAAVLYCFIVKLRRASNWRATGLETGRALHTYIYIWRTHGPRFKGWVRILQFNTQCSLCFRVNFDACCSLCRMAFGNILSWWACCVPILYCNELRFTRNVTPISG